MIVPELPELCQNSSLMQTIYFLKTFVNIICIISPIILTLIMMLNLFKNLTNEEDNKKVISNFLKKIAITISIFLIPILINSIMKLITNNNLPDYLACWNSADINTIKELKKEEANEKEQLKNENNSNNNNNNTPANINLGLEYIKDNNSSYPYYAYFPDKETSNKSVIIWLHGSGEFIDDKNQLLYSGLLGTIKSWPNNLEYFNAIVLAPHNIKQSKGWKNSTDADKLKKFVDYMISKYNLNKNKIILSGHSLGGAGVMYMSSIYQNTFAAIVPISVHEDVNDYKNSSNYFIKNISYFSRIPIRIYSEESSFYKNITNHIYNSINNPDKFKKTFDTAHGRVPYSAYTFDSDKNGKSDLLEWIYLKTK